MYPHERSLVKRMQNKPFTLLGVNSDEKPRIEKAMKDQGIVWPFFFDGGSPGGPIAKAWGVEQWPTIYVIDAKGVIRYVDPEDLDKAVDKLIKETPMPKKGAATRPAGD